VAGAQRPPRVKRLSFSLFLLHLHPWANAPEGLHCGVPAYRSRMHPMQFLFVSTDLCRPRISGMRHLLSSVHASRQTTLQLANVHQCCAHKGLAPSG
jgi:hypothetical protein